ncbi:MAG TPA: acetyl-CoA carboxylase biotin carboxylase subunit [Bacteroidia bacterium]|nr:acetyl-CoA carboxylase biotin carboxylase subunit [Bacteroidia bacterium]
MKKRTIHKILIANRGEIALRIIRSAKEMGIKTVAVYSEADKNAPFVRYADESYLLGPPPSNQSYLLGDKIIEIALQCKADAIHPGYGFLSENANFAEKVIDAGIIFIGPPPSAMRKIGDKLSAKETAKSQNVPMISGSDGAIKDIKEAKKVAEKIGFPLLIKASAGGGGKGMRLVHSMDELEESVQRAMSEALSAFGDDAVFIEKYAEEPKHIEVQILGDQYGNVVYLFERECSIQRRHQKVIEEAPSPVVSDEMRKKMGECAVALAKAVGYYNAGTVEFLVDKHRNFYFLEVNARLQVEHPVTEMITGLDLVKEQIKIAMGEPLSFTQNDLKINGHAIEVRVSAEDPLNNFLPDVGKLLMYQRPQGHGIRVDDGYEEGMEIPIYYDPMIAKLIVHAKDRTAAIDKMIRAINEFKIVGVETTLDFCKFVLKHPDFVSGKFDTNFVAKYFQPELLTELLSEEEKEVLSIFAGAYYESEKNKLKQINHSINQQYTSEWYRRRK